MVLHKKPWAGQYRIEEDGTIHSMRSGKALKPRWNGNHWQVVLYDAEGRRHAQYVHNLVLECFVGPRPEGLKGLHRDDDPDNNHVSNLYWGTSSQNTHDSVRNGGHHHAKKTHCKRGHLLEGPNLASWMSHGRCCKACNRALSHARWLGIQGDEEKIAALADQKFAAIMIDAGGS